MIDRLRQVDWLTVAASSISAVFGSLVGAWWQKRATDKTAIGGLLSDQFGALWSDQPRQRAAARDTIWHLLTTGVLSDQQRLAASEHLKHWAAANWELSDEERRTPSGPSGCGGTRG